MIWIVQMLYQGFQRYEDTPFSFCSTSVFFNLSKTDHPLLCRSVLCISGWVSRVPDLRLGGASSSSCSVMTMNNFSSQGQMSPGSKIDPSWELLHSLVLVTEPTHSLQSARLMTTAFHPILPLFTDIAAGLVTISVGPPFPLAIPELDGTLSWKKQQGNALIPTLSSSSQNVSI